MSRKNRDHVRGAACLAVACLLAAGAARPDELGPDAYTIIAEPKPGPIEVFQPIEELPPVAFELPFDWGMDPFGDATWQFQLHGLTMLDPILAADDFAYAGAVFRDWQQWHADREARYSWNDHATGQRAARLAYLLRATDWQDDLLVALAEGHAEKLRDPAFVRDDHNHGIFQLHGLAALCLDSRLPACRKAGGFLEAKLSLLLRNQFTRSGVHRENSPGYHFYALANLSLMAPILGSHSADYAETLRRAGNKSKWLIHPDFATVAVGDSTAALRADTRIPRGDLRCEGVRSYRQAPECYRSRHFEKVGYVIVRSNWSIPAEQASMLFVQGGFFNYPHRDADDFSFEWFERGRRIMTDSGKYGYTRDSWEDYFDSTRAHNTVEVDGRNFSTRQRAAYGDAVRYVKRTSRGFMITMRVYHSDLQVWHRRRIDFRPGEALRIRDAMRSNRPRTYVQWHHFTRAIELTGDDGRFEAGDGELLVDIETTTSCGNKTKHRMTKGQTEPRLQGWASLEDRERHARWALGVECEARSATLDTRFEITAR